MEVRGGEHGKVEYRNVVCMEYAEGHAQRFRMESHEQRNE